MAKKAKPQIVKGQKTDGKGSKSGSVVKGGKKGKDCC